MSKSRAKGTSFESSLLPALRTLWPRAERRALQGSKDKGDFSGTPWVLEAKNCRRLELAGWMKEAEQECRNAGGAPYAVIHKKRGSTDPMDQYVTLPLSIFLLHCQ